MDALLKTTLMKMVLRLAVGTSCMYCLIFLLGRKTNISYLVLKAVL